MPHGIYDPADAAEYFAKKAGKKFRPSNGTEGECFIDSWCGECARDVDDDCPIVAATFAFDVGDDEYPAEWQYGTDGQPKCTAWVALDDPIPTPRCDQTADMFATPTGGGSHG